LATFVCDALVLGSTLVERFPTAVTLVGALIFVLGIDLIREAVWDPRHRASRFVSNIHYQLRCSYNYVKNGVSHYY
jgi:MFS superfamily sulfate permease-like transporter